MTNATWIAQVFVVDDRHVALSCQFFRKTRANLDAHPSAQLLVTDPTTVAQWRLDVRFLRSETEGPTFDTIKARIETIASSENAEHLLALRSADIFEVLAIRPVEIERPSLVEPKRPSVDALSGLARLTESIAACTDLPSLVDTGLNFLVTQLGYPCTTLYLYEESERALYTLASRGFARSGVGARIGLGIGVVGMCARYKRPIRIADTPRDRRYGRAVKQQLARVNQAQEHEIPLPGLEGMASMLAVPLLVRGKLFGVIATESEQLLAFDEGDAGILTTAGQALAQAIALFPEDDGEREPPAVESPRRGTDVLRLRYYPADDSVFVDDEYLIKGLPGRILWLLLKLREREGRTTFSNRELRRHPFLKLPGYKDNLETRLLVLQRRLEDKGVALRLDREERGRLRLVCDMDLELEVVGPEASTDLRSPAR